MKNMTMDTNNRAENHIEDGTSIIFDGKEIGTFRYASDGMLEALLPKNSEKHLFRKYNSYGIAKEVLESDDFKYVERICVVVDGGRQVLITGIETWMEEGILYRGGGYELQVHLPIDRFDEVYS